MKTLAALATALGLCASGCANLVAGQARPTLPYAEIYQRATNEFAEATFFKPAEPKTNELTSSLAPLILQEVNGGTEALSRLDWFGTLGLSNGVLILDRTRPAIYWQADSVQIRGRAHARFSYVWCYSTGASGAKCGLGTDDLLKNPNSADNPLTPALSPSEGERENRRQFSGEARRGILSPGQTEGSLALQGIRITLDSAGLPVIWEVLADRSGAELICVSQNLEAAAVAEYGKPLSGRRYTIERSREEAPNVIVARVIDDGPVAMGPIVYLSAGTRAVSTLICRCMPAQAKRLLGTSVYDLLPFESAAAQPLLTQARALTKEPTAFWPGDPRSRDQLEKRLRLPSGF